MADRDLRRLSRTLSLLLRHHPERFGVQLDEHGWALVDQVLAGLRAAGRDVDRDRLQRVVHENDKRRFALSDDGARIRAVQGHSLPVDLQLEPRRPPDQLFHGTVAAALPAIRRQGLLPRGRHHVHLSCDAATAAKVGGRRGRPVVLTVAAAAMHGDGHAFFRSENGVWLCAAVPPRYLHLHGSPDDSA